MPHKQPYRPTHDVSQVYNDGVVTICKVVGDVAEAGRLPSDALEEQQHLPYAERKLGVNRYYQAKQNQIHVERVIRVPKPPQEVTSQNVAQTEDGRRYRIDLVQLAEGVYPTSLDLTLVAYTQTAGGNEIEGGLDV